MPPEAHTGRSTDKQEERTEEDAESVFSDSEEEEGEVIGGRRDVASDAEDEGEAIQVSNHEVAADHAANQLGGLSLAKAQESDAGSASDESIYEDGEVQEGYESDGEEGEGADDEEKPVAPARPPRKVLEPYEVPTSGAFWMHDDRGGDEEVEEGPSQRRPKKKLYDPDDDGDKWQHDRFDLLEMPPEYDQYQGFLQRERGRGRGRGRRGRQEEENAPPGIADEQGIEGPRSRSYNNSQLEPSARGGRRRGRGRGRGRRLPDDHPEAADRRAEVVDSYRAGPRGGGRGRRGGRGRSDGGAYGNSALAADGRGQRGRGGGRGGQGGRGSAQGSQERNDEWPSLPGALQPSASGSKLNAAAKDFTPPGSEHGGAAAAAAPPAEANGLLPYRPYVPQPMPAPQVAYGVPVTPGFAPGPMQQSTGYAASAAMQRPVKRPVTIQSPPDQQRDAFPPPQQEFTGEAGFQGHNSAPAAARGRGGRRYSAMSGSVFTS